MAFTLLHIVCETFLRPFMYRPELGVVKARNLGVRLRVILFSKAVEDDGDRSADICLIM